METLIKDWIDQSGEGLGLPGELSRAGGSHDETTARLHAAELEKCTLQSANPAPRTHVLRRPNSARGLLFTSYGNQRWQAGRIN